MFVTKTLNESTQPNNSAEAEKPAATAVPAVVSAKSGNVLEPAVDTNDTYLSPETMVYEVKKSLNNTKFSTTKAGLSREECDVLDQMVEGLTGIKEIPIARHFMGQVLKITGDVELARAMVSHYNPQNHMDVAITLQMLMALGTGFGCHCKLMEGGHGQAGQEFLINAQLKSSRTFTPLATLLAELKGKLGPRNMTVERVDVGEGGQAIVGSNINLSPKRPKKSKKREEESGK